MLFRNSTTQCDGHCLLRKTKTITWQERLCESSEEGYTDHITQGGRKKNWLAYEAILWNHTQNSVELLATDSE